MFDFICEHNIETQDINSLSKFSSRNMEITFIIRLPKVFVFYGIVYHCSPRGLKKK